jgi:diguanylate cyclase
VGDFLHKLQALVRDVAAPFSRGVLKMTLLAAVFVLLVSWLVWDHLAERRMQETAEHFAMESAEIALRIGERFRGYRQVLRGGRALFHANSESVSRQMWREYVHWLRLEEDFAGIQGVGFSQWVPAAALEEHLRRVREEGFADYQVWPEGARDAYSSIVMLEPFDWRNQRAFGYDMYADPVRREAMERAVAAGRDALSGRVTLVQETDADLQAGVLLYLPVYASGAEIETEAQRREALLGWVYSPFRMNDLIAGKMGYFAERVRLRIYDEGRQAPETQLYDSHPGHAPPGASHAVHTQTLVLGGREWLLVTEALEADDPHAAAALQTELIAIALVGLMFVLVTWSFSVTYERARAMERAAMHDSLTGVSNRLSFGDLLEQTIKVSGRYGHRFALLFVDLDNFKEVNDEFGHHVGDQLLVGAVQRMQECVRSSDTLARYGGDEFVVLLPEIVTDTDVDVVAEKIRNALETPFLSGGHELRISSSIGVVRYPDHGNDGDTLLRRADEAMYSAKAQGRNRTHHFGA